MIHLVIKQLDGVFISNTNLYIGYYITYTTKIGFRRYLSFSTRKPIKPSNLVELDTIYYDERLI